MLTIICGQLLFTAAHAGLTISFYNAADVITALAAPFIYDFLALVSWISGMVTAGFGILILVNPLSKVRAPLFNVWIALLLLHMAIVIVYGIHAVQRLRDLYLIHYDFYSIFTDKNLWAGKSPPDGEPQSKVSETMSPGGMVYDTVESISASIILSVAPYPFNFLFFMGMRVDVSALFYIVLPSTFVLLSLPFAVAIRNYFASTRAAIVKHREPYEGRSLAHFICAGVPGKNSDEEYHEEEDLASTFYDSSSEEQEDYTSSSDDQGEGEEGESLLPSAASSRGQRAVRA